MVEDHTKIDKHSDPSCLTIVFTERLLFSRTNLKPQLHKTKYSSRVRGSSVHLVSETSFPPTSSLPILLEITLLQLHWNWTKKHLVRKGAENLHMVALCGWDHLATCLQSVSPGSYTITHQIEPLCSCVYHLLPQCWCLMATLWYVINAVLRGNKFWAQTLTNQHTE